MRTGPSRRVRASHPAADLVPLMKRATPQRPRSSPRAPRAARARAGLALGPRRSPSRGTAASPRRRRRRPEGGEGRSREDADSDGTLSIVDGIRGMDCGDDGPEERALTFGPRRLRPCEGTEGLLLLSMIAEAQEGCKSRKRVKLPDVPARRCGYCGARSTVQWRSGPKEVPILCNACGVKYRKGKLQLGDMADRALEIDDLENGAALGMLHLVDQTSGNSNSSAALGPRLQAGQLQPKTPRCSSASTAGAWPSGNGPEGLLQGSLGTAPTLWGFVPQMVAPAQPRPVPLQPHPQFGQMFTSTDTYVPMLPVPPVVHAEEVMNSWGRAGGHAGWRSHPAWGLRRGSLDGPMEDGENEGASGVGCPVVLQEVLTKPSPRRLDSKEPANGTMKNEGDVTLRWLAKRKRTGPKVEV